MWNIKSLSHSEWAFGGLQRCSWLRVLISPLLWCKDVPCPGESAGHREILVPFLGQGLTELHDLGGSHLMFFYSFFSPQETLHGFMRTTEHNGCD